MRILKVLVPVFVFVLSLGGQARPARGDGFRPGQMMKELNLTSEQKDQVKAQFKSQKDSMRSLREQRKVAHEKLESAFKSNGSDEALKAAHQEMQSAQARVATARFENLLALRKILTPEQRTKFDQMRAERMSKAMGAMKYGHGGDDDDDE